MRIDDDLRRLKSAHRKMQSEDDGEVLAAVRTCKEILSRAGLRWIDLDLVITIATDDDAIYEEQLRKHAEDRRRNAIDLLAMHKLRKAGDRDRGLNFTPRTVERLTRWADPTYEMSVTEIFSLGILCGIHMHAKDPSIAL